MYDYLCPQIDYRGTIRSRSNKEKKVESSPPRVLSSKIARTGAQSTPLGLERNRVHAPLPHPIRNLMQAGQRRRHVSTGSAPEELCGGSRAGPDDGVEVLRAGLLGPEEVLAAEDELGLGGCEVGGGVEGVGELPGLEGVAP